MGYKTEQEQFWAGEFGDNYIERNNSKKDLSSQLSLWGEILKYTENVNSFIEFGSNIGLNLQAIKLLFPNSEMSAIEINTKAADILKSLNLGINVFNCSILDFTPNKTFDFVLISGVLIHQQPETLIKIYDLLYKSSNKYILINEYYSPLPVEISYRGHSNKLFKRDFAGEMLDIYKNLKLINYGFKYHRDNVFPQDDTTWFLLEKI